MAVPQRLLAITAPTKGSGRKSGTGLGLERTAPVLAMGALEAGLEQLFLAKHGTRLNMDWSSVNDDIKNTLATAHIQSPSASKIQRALRVLFGIELSTHATGPAPWRTRSVYSLKLLHKNSSHGGRGTPKAGPDNWAEMVPFLDSLAVIRNKTAHGDRLPSTFKRKSTNQLDPAAQGYLACLTKSGNDLTIQRPHAISAILIAAQAFNIVCLALANATPNTTKYESEIRSEKMSGLDGQLKQLNVMKKLLLEDLP